MTKFIKRILYKLLGRKQYLLFISKLFFILYKINLLKNNQSFEFHYFIKKLVKNDDHIIDIGANLGYYSRLFSKLVGTSGKVFSVEPIPLYRQLLRINTRKCKNIEIVPFALGEKDGVVEMGIPGNDIFRHGLTRIVSDKETKFSNVVKVDMKTPQEVFNSVNKLNYIKCDVEGYENFIIPQLDFLISKYHPAIQIELALENRMFIFEYLSNHGYSGYELNNKQLNKISSNSKVSGDTLFIHNDSKKFDQLIF
ncbi:FkbM family methyltransferase [Methanococcoides sp. SA1]|nr:FkbM family methyltransferase [Methanococcoides sp. SA1]